MEPQSITSPAYDSLRRTWEGFIDSVMREWKTFNIISVLLLSAILTILQIDAAAKDPITRYTALASLICALISLLYGCMYIIRFGTMRKPYKAAEWALEAKKTGTSVLWNVWVLLAMPAVWLSWSLILYICCIMSFLWRTTTFESEPYLLSMGQLLAIRILISSLLLIGMIYGSLIIATFARYGDAMDQAWKKRINGWIEARFTDTILGEPAPAYPPYSPAYPPPTGPSPWARWPPSPSEKTTKEGEDYLEDELTMLKELGQNLNRSMPPDNWIPAFEDGQIVLPPPHELALTPSDNPLSQVAIVAATPRNQGTSTGSRSPSRPDSIPPEVQNQATGEVIPLTANHPASGSPNVDKSMSQNIQPDSQMSESVAPLPIPPPAPPIVVPVPQPLPRDELARLWEQNQGQFLHSSRQPQNWGASSPSDKGDRLARSTASNQRWTIDEEAKESVLSWLSKLPSSLSTPSQETLEDASPNAAQSETGDALLEKEKVADASDKPTPSAHEVADATGRSLQEGRRSTAEHCPSDKL